MRAGLDAIEPQQTELLLHKLTLEACAALDEGDPGKREVIRRLGTSASQLYRLLDAAYHAKSVGQWWRCCIYWAEASMWW